MDCTDFLCSRFKCHICIWALSHFFFPSNSPVNFHWPTEGQLKRSWFVPQTAFQPDRSSSAGLSTPTIQDYEIIKCTSCEAIQLKRQFVYRRPVIICAHRIIVVTSHGALPTLYVGSDDVAQQFTSLPCGEVKQTCPQSRNGKTKLVHRTLGLSLVHSSILTVTMAQA